MGGALCVSLRETDVQNTNTSVSGIQVIPFIWFAAIFGRCAFVNALPQQVPVQATTQGGTSLHEQRSQLEKQELISVRNQLSEKVEEVSETMKRLYAAQNGESDTIRRCSSNKRWQLSLLFNHKIDLLKNELQVKYEEIMILRNESLSSQADESRVPIETSNNVVYTITARLEDAERELMPAPTQLPVKIEGESRATEWLNTAQNGTLMHKTLVLI